MDLNTATDMAFVGYFGSQGQAFDEEPIYFSKYFYKGSRKPSALCIGQQSTRQLTTVLASSPVCCASRCVTSVNNLLSLLVDPYHRTSPAAPRKPARESEYEKWFLDRIDVDVAGSLWYAVSCVGRHDFVFVRKPAFERTASDGKRRSTISRYSSCSCLL